MANSITLDKDVVKVDPAALAEVACDRITCQFVLHHISCEAGDPVTVQTVFQELLASKEQPYVRRLRLAPEWRAIDLGWIKEPGLVVLQNKSTNNKLVQPTPEQVAAVKARRLLWGVAVAYGSGGLATPKGLGMAQVKPGQAVCLDLAEPRHLYLAAASDYCDVTISVFPK